MLTRQPENDSMIPGCFACHVDCATGCHTDDQPFDHPYAYHPPTFEEDTVGDEAEEELRSPKSYDPQQENSNLDKDEDNTRGPVSGQQARSDVLSPRGARCIGARRGWSNLT